MKNQARSTFSLQSSVILADALGTLADFLFWGLIVMCGYWFIFYKLQVIYNQRTGSILLFYIASAKDV